MLGIRDSQRDRSSNSEPVQVQLGHSSQSQSDPPPPLQVQLTGGAPGAAPCVAAWSRPTSLDGLHVLLRQPLRT
jgi:hypothetical protein